MVAKPSAVAAMPAVIPYFAFLRTADSILRATSGTPHPSRKQGPRSPLLSARRLERCCNPARTAPGLPEACPSGQPGTFRNSGAAHRVAVDGEVLLDVAGGADLPSVLDGGQGRVGEVLLRVLQVLQQVEHVDRAGALVAGAYERVGRVRAV